MPTWWSWVLIFVLNDLTYYWQHRADGDVFIVWDRFFRSFEPEVEPVVDGLTRNITTYNPVRVAFREYAAMVRGLGSVTGLRSRLTALFGRPAQAAAVVAASR